MGGGGTQDDRWMYGLWQQESDDLDDNSHGSTATRQTADARGAATACEVRFCSLPAYPSSYSASAFVELQLPS